MPCETVQLLNMMPFLSVVQLPPTSLACQQGCMSINSWTLYHDKGNRLCPQKACHADVTFCFVKSAECKHGGECSAERTVRGKPAEAMAMKEMALLCDEDKRYAWREVAALRAVKTKLQKVEGPHHILEYVDHQQQRSSVPGQHEMILITR